MNKKNVVGDRDKQTINGPSLNRKACIYTKGGRCKEHGEGARRHWKPDGTKLRRTTRKIFYVCDLGTVGKKMTQTRLSFTKTTVKDILDIGGDRVESLNFDLPVTTCTEGQNSDEQTMDKKLRL